MWRWLQPDPRTGGHRPALRLRAAPTTGRATGQHPAVVVAPARSASRSRSIWLARHAGRALEADTALSTGSRAICYAKRWLEVLDRLGVGEQELDTA